MSANTALVVRRERGWRMGFTNFLAKEMSSWWRTRQWWVHSLIALLLLNGTMALNLKDGGGVNNAAYSFLMTAGLCVPFAAISLAQDSILGERHSGTAAWVLSKPIRRPAFVLAKVMAHGLGLLVAWVALPGAVAFFQLHKYFGTRLSAPGFAGAMGLDYLNLLFYMTLALMLATLFNGRGPVLGISLVVAWSGPMQFIAQPMQKYAPWLENILPWRLMVDFSRSGPLAGYLAMGQRLPTVAPIVATALWCVLFVAVAIWRIRRDEF
jgi:ABC-type transport system involved in multi-copper enzyme maturation permease subunit